MTCPHSWTKRYHVTSCPACLADEILLLRLRLSVTNGLVNKYVQCYLNKTEPKGGREEAMKDLIFTAEKI